jgi:branched-chain amino acid transport system substrate-binding protein
MTLRTRRRFLRQAGAGLGAAAAAGFVPMRFAIGQKAKLKIGLMLPYTGTFAALGHNITDAMKMRLAEGGNKLGGREFDIVQLDDESAPPKGKDNAARLLVREKCDLLVGTVHSGVVLAMAQVAKEENKFLIIPNAGAVDLTRKGCWSKLFRTSFSNWQPAFPAGDVALKDGHKTAVIMTWNYPAGHDSAQGFKDSFTKGGGKIVKEILLDFPKVEFQAGLTEIASLKPDCVYVFFAGAGALKYMKDYEAAGLKARIPLYGPGFLTDGVYKQAGSAAEGIKTTLHYADDLDTPINKRFRADFKKATNREADVYAVQGYDTGTFLIQGLQAVQGDLGAEKALIKAWESAKIESPRGTFTLSKSHDPIQDIYLRQVWGGDEKYLGVAHKALADPGTGCVMS